VKIDLIRKINVLWEERIQMPKSYSDEQNQVFIDFMEDYRNLIEDKTEKETVILTKSFAI